MYDSKGSTHQHTPYTHGRRVARIGMGQTQPRNKTNEVQRTSGQHRLHQKMSSHPRDDASGLKPAFPARRSDDFLEEELAARNICNRKHGCSVLLSVPDAFTTHICEHTVNYLAGQDLYIPSEVEHSKWYLEVYTSPSRPSRNRTSLRLTPVLLQVIAACISKHSELIERCIQILGRWLQMVSIFFQYFNFTYCTCHWLICVFLAKQLM